MAKLTIEIDTGVLAKLDGRNPRSNGFTVAGLIGLVQEASKRLSEMGASANGVVLYGPDGPRGRITLTESDKRKGEPRNWYDDTVHAGGPLSERRDGEKSIGLTLAIPNGVKIVKRGSPSACGGWHWVNTLRDTENGPFASPKDARDDSMRVAAALIDERYPCRQNVCWCHDDGTELITPYCSHCGCKT